MCVLQVMGNPPRSPYYPYGIDSTLAGADDLWATTGVRMHYGLGCHPIHAAEWTDALGAQIRARFAQPGALKDGLVCVGEMGLDYQRVDESCVFMCAAIRTFFMQYGSAHTTCGVCRATAHCTRSANAYTVAPAFTHHRHRVYGGRTCA